MGVYICILVLGTQSSNIFNKYWNDRLSDSEKGAGGELFGGFDYNTNIK